MRFRTLAVAPWLMVQLLLAPPITTRGDAAAAADPAPTYTITLGPRTACVTPRTTRQARADGGVIDLQLSSSTVVIATLTGTAAANAILGCESAATQTFHLEQEFIIEHSDSKVQDVSLTMESTLIGLVRAKHKATASAQLASAKICPVGVPDSPLVMVHPSFGVGGTSGRLCNQRLTPIKVPGMPLGRYVLVADFVLVADAMGLTDGHSAADFSPSTALPSDWVRTRDPFQGVDKKDFGFRVVLTAEAAGSPTVAAVQPSRPLDSALARTALRSPAASKPSPRPIQPTGRK